MLIHLAQKYGLGTLSFDLQLETGPPFLGLATCIAKGVHSFLICFNPWTYTQIHTLTAVQKGGGWNPSPEFLQYFKTILHSVVSL